MGRRGLTAALAQEEAEAGDDEAEAGSGEAEAHPRKESPLVGEVVADARCVLQWGMSVGCIHQGSHPYAIRMSRTDKRSVVATAVRTRSVWPALIVPGAAQ